MKLLAWIGGMNLAFGLQFEDWISYTNLIIGIACTLGVILLGEK